MNTVLENQNIEPKPWCQPMRKHIPSKLEPFTEPLLQMEAEGKTIDQMLDWLKEREVTTARSNLSVFLKNKREERAATEQLDGDKNLYETVHKWIRENPNPSLEAVIERLKMVAISLSMRKEAAPEILRLADRLSQTAIRFVSAQSRETNDRSREDYRTRKLVMEEAKHAEWVKCERTRAMELCLDESKKYPDIANMYRAAFDALRKRRKENGEWD